MTDRVYPAAKPNPPPGMNGTAAAANGAGPAKTTQLYNPNRPRPMYRPPPQRQRRCCSCRKFCCLCFIYTLIAILSLILLAAIAACIFYVLYHPKHPTFSVSSVRISKFNLSAADSNGFSTLSSRLDFTVTAKNPNKKKIVFVYDPITVDVAAAGVNAGNTTVPGFTHVEGNTTVIKGTMMSDPTRSLDSDSVAPLRADLGKKSGFPVSVEINTQVKVQMGKLKTQKVGMRVSFDRIRGFLPPKPAKNSTKKAVAAAPATTTGAKCKVDLRIKIWKFTF